jgi:cytochrome P450
MTVGNVETNIDAVALPVHRSPGCPFDPPPELGHLQAERPIVRITHQDGYVGWLVTSHAVARSMLADPRFSARPDLRRVAIGTSSGKLMAEPSPGEFINMDRPEHSRYRRLLTRHFTEDRLNRMREWILRTVDEHLDAMAEAGPPVDLVSALTLPVPALVICELLGVPEAHRASIQEKSTTIANAESSQSRGMAGFSALAGYLRQLSQHKRAKPADDLLSVLAASDELTDQELTNIALGLVLGGNETTANMIALGVFTLLEHPEQCAALRTDPSSIDRSVEELLRYLTITHLGLPYRAALEDLELGGQPIRKGETVTVALPIVNRDPSIFTDPHRLWIDRPDAGRHLAFGYGVHQCLGQHLARIELRIAYLALFDRFPGLRLAVPAAEVPMRETTFIYGPRRLPVTWERTAP